MQTAIFPGTFDPITIGHEDLIKRAAKIFPQVIVAVAKNNPKNPVFDLEQRIKMAEEALDSYKNVKVMSFNNLLVQFAREQNATVIVRGVRIATDFDYELQLANMNRSMDAEIETIFLTPSPQFSYISSTLVKEISRLNGDVSCFVNKNIALALKGVVWP